MFWHHFKLVLIFIWAVAHQDYQFTVCVQCLAVATLKASLALLVPLLVMLLLLVVILLLLLLFVLLSQHWR